MVSRSYRLALVLRSAVALALLAGTASAQPGFVRGRLLAKFQAGTGSERVAATLSAVQARVQRELPGIGVLVLELPTQADEAAYARALAARPEVEFVELDRIVPPADVIPNDPWYPDEWHLPKIAAPSAWSTTTGSSSIVIAIVDTGVDGTHEDLASKMAAGWNIYEGNANASDVYGHGTKVAGAAAAAGNNGVGVPGVAWQCLIMPVRVSAADGTATYSAIASGLTWAADHGARVANVSYMVTTSSTVTSAAQHFQSKGGVVTVSAGNYSSFDSSPDNRYIVTVSATDGNDLLYSWSNTGNNIDVAAPGCLYTTVRGGGYSLACGTSFSAPITAGVAALVLSLRPALTPAEVTTILQQSADDRGPAGWDPSFGWGRVNAAKAVALASGGAEDTQAPTVSFVTPTSGSTVSGTVSLQVGASDNVGVTSVTITVDGATLCTLSAAPYTCSWNTTAVANGSHTLAAAARDAAGNQGGASVAVSVTNAPADTTAPTVAITSPKGGSTVSGSVSVAVDAKDNVAVVKVELYVDGVLKATSKSAPFTTKWNSRQAASGQHTLSCKAYDQQGNAGNSAPVSVYK